ncbi:MAG TPA: alpha-L-fucosidase [Acidobacteriota bacterium]|jgi:alpha-L-fucosidase
MMITRRTVTKSLAGAVPLLRGVRALAIEETGPQIQPGPFKGTRESLQAYHVPDWFRDAKFGIWAHAEP